MLNCSEIAHSALALPLVESCDVLHDGSIRKWHDLQRPDSENGIQHVTIYNSQSRVIKREDLERLQEYSSIVSYPQEEELLGSLLVA